MASSSITKGATGMGIVTATLAYYMHVKTVDEVPFTKRRRHLVTSQEYEAKVGAMAVRSTLKSAKVLPSDHAASVTVRSIGERLAAHAPASVGGPKKWSFTVVSDKNQPNAFASPPNHVVLYSGIFKYGRTEDEIASVIAHEMGHVLCRHTGEKLSDEIMGSAGVTLLSQLASTVFGIGAGAAYEWLSVGRGLVLTRPNSRNMEREADYVGLKLIGGACFDVNAASNTFRRMQAEQGTNSAAAGYLSTHPGHGERVKNMSAWAKEVIRENKGREGECAEIRRRWELARRGNKI